MKPPLMISISINFKKIPINLKIKEVNGILMRKSISHFKVSATEFKEKKRTLHVWTLHVMSKVKNKDIK